MGAISFLILDLDGGRGDWKDKSDDVRVDTTVRWSDKRSFLVRSYTVESDEDDEVHQGKMVTVRGISSTSSSPS